MLTNYPTPISTITPAALVTPQVSRKLAKNMNKKELEVEVNRLRGKLRDEIKSLKSKIDELKKERGLSHLVVFIKEL